jgi:hypothetical protein
MYGVAHIVVHVKQSCLRIMFSVNSVRSTCIHYTLNLCKGFSRAMIFVPSQSVYDFVENSNDSKYLCGLSVIDQETFIRNRIQSLHKIHEWAEVTPHATRLGIVCCLGNCWTSLHDYEKVQELWVYENAGRRMEAKYIAITKVNGISICLRAE